MIRTYSIIIRATFPVSADRSMNVRIEFRQVSHIVYGQTTHKHGGGRQLTCLNGVTHWSPHAGRVKYKTRSSLIITQRSTIQYSMLDGAVHYSFIDSQTRSFRRADCALTRKLWLIFLYSILLWRQLASVGTRLSDEALFNATDRRHTHSYRWPTLLTTKHAISVNGGRSIEEWV